MANPTHFQAFAITGKQTLQLCHVVRETGETRVDWSAVQLCAADVECPTRGLAQLMLAIRDGRAEATAL
jgi:hypothetical protein